MKSTSPLLILVDTNLYARLKGKIFVMIRAVYIGASPIQFAGSVSLTSKTAGQETFREKHSIDYLVTAVRYN